MMLGVCVSVGYEIEVKQANVMINAVKVAMDWLWVIIVYVVRCLDIILWFRTGILTLASSAALLHSINPVRLRLVWLVLGMCAR